MAKIRGCAGTHSKLVVCPYHATISTSTSRRQQVNYADLTNTAPVYNQSSYTNNINPIPQTNNNQQSDKFNPSELFGIFNQMIDVVQQCKSKGEQLKALNQIICQYLI